MDEQKKEEFNNFIEEARQSKTHYKRFLLNEAIPQRLADAIKEVIGIDVSDYKNEIYEDIVRHIEKDHGEYGLSDHSMKDMHKLGRIDSFLSDFDCVEKGKESGNQKFKNSDQTKAKTIEIKKNFQGELGHLIEAIPISNKRSLEVCSMYYNKQKEDTVQEPDVKSPGVTSETNSANSVSSNKIIGKEKDTVNNQIIKDLKKNNFLPSSGLVNNMKKLHELVGNQLSIADVSNMYSGIKNPEIQDIVKSIAEECAQQEKARKVPTLNE